MKVASLALGYHGSVYWYNTRATFEPSPYDFDRIMQAVDTDSYIRQAMNKYKELFWKENWQIVGENPEAVAYLYQRIDFLEMTMKRPFLDFLIEVSDQLFKFANVFIVKARGDISEYFPDKYVLPKKQTNYELYVKLAIEYHINYIDFNIIYLLL